MSYYTDISKITRTSTWLQLVTSAYLSNTCGDLLESTGYFKIYAYADTTKASSDSNACIVDTKDNKIRIKLFQTSSSNTSSLSLQMIYLDTNTIISSIYSSAFSSTIISNSPYYILNTSIRILHLKNGVMFYSPLSNSVFLTVLTVKDVNTNLNYNVYSIDSTFSIGWGNLGITDGINITYGSSPIANLRDATNQKQYLLPLCFSAGGAVRYINEDHFSNNAGMIFPGFVEMNGAIYYCSNYHAFKLEDR